MNNFINLIKIGEITVHKDLRQATSIVLKNRIRDYCSGETKGLPSSPEEKENLKSNLVEILLIENVSSIRGILAECIRIVSEFEFPEK